MKRIIGITALILIMLSFTALGQNFRKADEAYDKKLYAQAIKYYLEAFEKAKDRAAKQHASLHIAHSYFELNDYKNAYFWYDEAETHGATGHLTASRKFFSKANAGKHEEALRELKLYTENNPNDRQTRDLYNKLNEYYSLLEMPNVNQVKNEEQINSPASEFPVGFHNGSLIFASTRNKNVVDDRTGEGFLDLYIAPYENVFPELLQNAELWENEFESRYHVATYVFSKSNSKAYVTMTERRTGNSRIYAFPYHNNTWGKPELLELTPRDYNAGHPTLTKDGRTMFFVSDMPGGSGNADIWMTRKSATGQWGAPTNLGENINTSGNDMFPFLYDDTYLFFASEGHNSFGGLDIFISEYADNKFSTPINIGVPYNSPADDFAMVIIEDGSGGFFASDRIDGKGGDDIYSFEGFPSILSASGRITNINTNEPVHEARVVFKSENIEMFASTNAEGYYSISGLSTATSYEIFVDAENYFEDKGMFETLDDLHFHNYTGEENPELNFALIPYPDVYANIAGQVRERATKEPMPREYIILHADFGISDITVTDDDGMYDFNFWEPASYEVRIEKPGYWVESRRCNAKDIIMPTTFSMAHGFDFDFELTKLEPKREIVLENIYYDLAKATLREESKEELDKIVVMLEENPSISIQISAHTDIRGSAEFNQRLSEARAKSVVDYLIAHGVDRNRLISRGYGETQLLIPDAQTEEEHQKNRRTTFQITEIATRDEGPSRYTPAPLPLRFNVVLYSEKNIRSFKEEFAKIYRFMPDITIIHGNSPIEGLNYYIMGAFDDLDKAVEHKKAIKNIGFVNCFIDVFEGTNRIEPKEILEIINNRSN